MTSIVSTFRRRSPRILLIQVALWVFCAETLVMVILERFPHLPHMVENLIDSTLLSILIAPVLYGAVYRPLLQEIHQQAQIEAELRRSQTSLKEKTLELEETLSKLQQAPQLIQAEKMSSLGQLVAGVAHEINNPVNFIYGNLNHVQEYTHDLINLLQTYQKHCPKVTEIQLQADKVDLEFLQVDLPKTVTSMQIGTERIQEIVQSLRNFSRLDEAESKVVDIHEGIDSTLLILQHRLKGTSGYPAIKIIKNYGQIPLVECYAGKLNQVWMNILSNAIDAIEEQNDQQPSPSGEPKITICTSVIDSQWVQVSIADNGTGIPKAIHEKIFDPFFTTKAVGKGTGLGMSISHQLITQQHGGKLKFFSAPKVGTEFFIQIPVEQPECNLTKCGIEM